jgi:hypothetical protein
MTILNIRPASFLSGVYDSCLSSFLYIFIFVCRYINISVCYGTFIEAPITIAVQWELWKGKQSRYLGDVINYRVERFWSIATAHCKGQYGWVPGGERGTCKGQTVRRAEDPDGHHAENIISFSLDTEARVQLLVGQKCDVTPELWGAMNISIYLREVGSSSSETRPII